MRYAESRYGEDPIAVGIFEEGTSGVVIRVLDLLADELLDLTTSGCTESAVVSGFYTWSGTNFVTPPTDFNQVLYVMEGPDGRQHPGKFLIGGYPSDSAVRRFGGKVWMDIDNGVSGTTYPNGTETVPVSGLTDAGIISHNENLPAYNVKGGLTLTSGHQDHSFEGVEPSDDTVTVQSGIVTSGCQFTKLGIRGTLDGRITAQDSLLSTAGGHLYDAWGLFENCGAQGTIHVRAGSLFQALSFASQSLIPGTILDMGNGGANIMLLLGQATGIYQISNQTTGFAGISMAGGQIQLNASCTGGLIFLFGTGRVIDNSDGSVVFNYVVDPTTMALEATLADHAADLDAVSGDLVTHNAALAAHDLVLDVVSADLATHVAALIDHALDLDAVSGDLVAHDGKLDVVSADVLNLDGDLVAHDGKLDGHITALATHDGKLDNVDADLVVHDGKLDGHITALAAHDGTLDVVSADVAALDTSGISVVQDTLDVVSADLLAHDGKLDVVSADVLALDGDLGTHDNRLTTHDAALATHDDKLVDHAADLDLVSGEVTDLGTDLAAHDAKLDVVAGDVERNYGRNTRTRLYYATAAISGATRVVPDGAASHMQTQVKTDAQADWSSPATFYVWFNYADAATSGDAPGAAEPNTAAPTDGSFRADGWPA